MVAVVVIVVVVAAVGVGAFDIVGTDLMILLLVRAVVKL